MHQRHHPTLLRRPDSARSSLMIEEVLAGDPWDYKIVRVGDAWAVQEHTTGALVYAGLGPVEIVRSPAPF